MTRLLTVNNYYYYRGGAETVFLEHNRVFLERGWEVIPFSMRHPRNLYSPWSGYFIDEIEFGSEYSLRERLVRLPKVIYSFEARDKLARLLDRARPALCHAHNIYHHISPAILGLLRQRELPVVLTLHDLKIACPAYTMLAPDGICERCKGGKLYNVVTHRCLKGSTALSAAMMLEAVLHRLLGSYSRSVSRFVVPSEFYIRKLCEWGWPRSLFRHVPNFVEAQRYRPEFTPGLEFLYVGRLSQEKGLETLLRAAAAAHVAVTIVGTGPLLEALRRLAADLDSRVRFTGYLSGEDLHDAIRGARAVVLPSEWYENAPMSVLESFALGKPVIGARIGGIPELIVEGETGAGFVSGDLESLTTALRSFSALPDREVETLGRQARRRVELNYSLSLYYDRMAAIYADLGVVTSASSTR